MARTLRLLKSLELYEHQVHKGDGVNECHGFMRNAQSLATTN